MSISKVTVLIYIFSSPIYSFHCQFVEPVVFYIQFLPLPLIYASFSFLYHRNGISMHLVVKSRSGPCPAPLFSLTFSLSNHPGGLFSTFAFTHQDQGTIISCLVYSNKLPHFYFFLLKLYSKAAKASLKEMSNRALNFPTSVFFTIINNFSIKNNFCILLNRFERYLQNLFGFLLLLLSTFRLYWTSFRSWSLPSFSLIRDLCTCCGALLPYLLAG